MQISAIGAQSIATILETNKVLEHLALNNCDLGDEGAEPIANGEASDVYVCIYIHSETRDERDRHKWRHLHLSGHHDRSPTPSHPNPPMHTLTVKRITPFIMTILLFV